MSLIKTARKTSLKSTSGPKKSSPKPKKRLKLEQKTAQQLVREADKWFSRYIRMRDSSYVDGKWVGPCITCPKQLVVRDGVKWTTGAQNGHCLSRGFHIIRYNEFNCNLQCSHCNAWLDKDEMTERYRKALALKYGEDTHRELKTLSKAENAHKMLTKPELLQIIADCKAYILHCELNPEHYS